MFSASIDTLQVVSVSTESTSLKAQGLCLVTQFPPDGLLSTIDLQVSFCDRLLLTYRICQCRVPQVCH